MTFNTSTMTRYTIGISPGKLTGIAIYDSEENNLMTYVDFAEHDTALAMKFVLNRINQDCTEGSVRFVFDFTPPQEWFEFCHDHGSIWMNSKKKWATPSDIFAELGIKVSNQPLANAVTMAMEKMKV